MDINTEALFYVVVISNHSGIGNPIQSTYWHNSWLGSNLGMTARGSELIVSIRSQYLALGVL